MTTLSERRDERIGGKVPPHSIEAEESVLGAILLSMDAANEVMDKLEPEDFYRPAHQSVFRAVRSLYNANQAIDAITVSEELRRTSELDRVGGVAFVTRLLDVVPSASNVDFYAGVVEEHSQRRELIKAGSSITDLALRLDDEIHEVLDRAEQTVLAVAGRKVGEGIHPIGPMFFSTLEELEELEARGSEVTGLTTGFRDLDRKLTGLHPANLVIVAARPAMGKCLVGSTRIPDPKTGAMVTIRELVEDPDRCAMSHLPAYDRETGRLDVAAPSAGHDNGVRPVFRLRTRLGREVTATANHPFLTLDGWRELRDLGVGDAIAVPRSIDAFGVDTLPDAEVALLGFLLGDGTLSGATPGITAAPGEVVADIRRWADALGLDLRRSGEDAAPLGALLGKHGLLGVAWGDAFVPDAVFRLTRQQLALFLSMLFAVGGIARTGDSGVSIAYRTESERVASDVQHLLLRFGVVGVRRRRGSRHDGGAGGAWEVALEDAGSLSMFGGEIGWTGSRSDFDMDSGETSLGKSDGRASADVLWDPIVSIEPAGEERTYDLTVPVHHNFVANDVVVHNSALSLNIATNVALEDKPVAVFSLEMSKEEVAQRMLCSVARIDSMKLRTGQIGEAAWPRLTDAAGKLYDTPVFVDDSPVVTVTDIRAKCRRLKRKHGLELVVVDYLQLMHGNARENRQQEIAEISRSLKNLARELEVPIIAVSQLNRNLESREDKRPRLGDLRESGSLEQDADIVVFIYRDEYYNEMSEKRGVAEVMVAKHRAGATGTVEMTFMPEFTKFSDLGRD